MDHDQSQGTPGLTPDTLGPQFVAGMPVFDAGGEKVGTVSAYNVQGGYLVVQQGWLFPKDVDVPRSMIQRNNADGVSLSLSKDDLATQDWEHPPVGSATTRGTTDMNAVDTTATTDGQTVQVKVADTADMRPPVREEELVLGTQEQETSTAPVTGERVRVQGNAPAVPADAFTEQDIDIPVMGEELVVGKRAVVTEEVRLHKQEITEQQQVSATVRKERVIVEGADEVRGADSVTTTDTVTGTDDTR
jgi:uncharacterized protein (TIGR02271 family)